MNRHDSSQHPPTSPRMYRGRCQMSEGLPKERGPSGTRELRHEEWGGEAFHTHSGAEKRSTPTTHENERRPALTLFFALHAPMEGLAPSSQTTRSPLLKTARTCLSSWKTEPL